MEAAIIIIILGIFIASLAYTWRLHRNLLSPPVAFGLGWLLPSLLTLYPHQFPYELEFISWAAVLLVYFSFIGGYFLATRVNIQPHKNKNRKINSIEIWKKPTFRAVIFILFLLSILGFLINLSYLIATEGITAYLVLNFNEIERIFGGVSPLFNYLYFLNALVLSLSILYSKIFQTDWFILILGLGSLSTMFFFGNKSAIILPLIIAVMTYYCVDLEVDLRLGLLAVIGAIGSFILVYFSGYGIELSVGEIRYIIGTATERMLLYIAPNYANLQENILQQTTATGGLHTLSSFVKLATLETVTVPTTDPHLVDPAYNVATFAIGYYLDYGWAGFVVPPFLIGAVSTYIYTWHLKSPSISSVTIYSIILTMHVMAFFANYYQRIQFWWFIFVIVLAYRIGSKEQIQIS